MALTRIGLNQSINLASNVTGTLPAANGGSGRTAVTGNILQVVSGIITYNTATTSTNYTDVLSASGTTWETAITLSSSSNKVLILPNLMVYTLSDGAAEGRYSITMNGKIGSGSYAQIGDSGTAVRFSHYDYGASGAAHGQTHSPSFLWSPNSTDELKIKFQIKGNGSEVEVSRSNYRSVINLLEVSA
jgi:hypothetical protein